MAIRFSTSRWTSANTRSSGSETSKNVFAQRPRRGQQRPLAPEHLVEPPARDVGEREQPQRLAGRRAVDDDASHSPSSTWRLSCSRQNSSSPPGGTVSSSAAIRSTPRSASTPAEPLLHGRPVALELVLRLHLLRPQAAADVGRLGADRAPPATRPASARGRWRARACAAPLRRSGVRWRRRPTSSRRRPCPCRGWSAAPWAPQSTVRFCFLGFRTSTVPSAVAGVPARSVAVSATS